MFKDMIKFLKIMQDPLIIYRLHKSPEYKQWIYDFQDCHSIFKFFEYGELNKDKQIYIIRILDPSWGFFAAWKRVCMGLLVAERYGFTPVVDWSNFKYRENMLVNGSYNPFEYYFELVSGVPVDEAQRSYNVTYYSRHTDGMVDTSYDLEGKLVQLFPTVNKKYIHVKPALYDAMIDQMKSIGLFNEKTVAVHIRRFGNGDLKGHPVLVPLELYMQKIEQAITDHGFEQIFLAVDSDYMVTDMKNRFGNRIITYDDVVRKPDGSAIDVADDDRFNQDGHRYRLGYEVLRDMLTLSFCDGLIAGISNVSLAAEVFKKSRGEEYSYRDMIKQELYTNGISISEIRKFILEGRYKLKD